MNHKLTDLSLAALLIQLHALFMDRKDGFLFLNLMEPNVSQAAKRQLYELIERAGMPIEVLCKHLNETESTVFDFRLFKVGGQQDIINITGSKSIRGSEAAEFTGGMLLAAMVTMCWAGRS